MAIDLTFPDEIEDARLLVRKFMRDTVRPRMAELQARKAKRDEWSRIDLRRSSRAASVPASSCSMRRL